MLRTPWLRRCLLPCSQKPYNNGVFVLGYCKAFFF
jgi:hypothetical protein